MEYLLLILAAAAAVWLFWKWKKEKETPKEETDPPAHPPAIKRSPAKPEEPAFETERIYMYQRPQGGWECPLCGGRNTDSDRCCRICLGKKTG